MITAEKILDAINSDNGLTFLQRLIEQEEVSTSSALSISAISKRAGLLSRSFLREVVVGKRPLTPASQIKFIKGIPLKGDLKKIFLELSKENRNLKTIQNLRSKLISNYSSPANRKKKSESFASALNSIDFFPVYASLGDDKGASVEEIRQRSGLAIARIQKALNHLITEGYVLEKDGRFFTNNDNHVVQLNLTDKQFNDFYKHRVSVLHHKAIKGVSSTESSMITCISINSKDLPLIKEELRSAIIEIAEKYEVSLGDSLGELILYFGKYTE